AAFARAGRPRQKWECDYKGRIGASRQIEQMRPSRFKFQSIPWWGYLLFVVLAAFALSRAFQERAKSIKASQPPVRPVLVAKVITKYVPLYLDEIGTCAAY